VRRVLPAVRRRSVGPFVFLDEMGPAALPAGHGIDVRPHPHIGLATVTYLFEGEMVHRDSLGSEQIIRPGEINWMSAGRGIAHSERSGSAARASGPRLHGLQLWTALPVDQEDGDPSFQHVSDLPLVEELGVRLRVLAGTLRGTSSAVKVASPTIYADITLDAGATLELHEDAELAVYPVSGNFRVDDIESAPARLVVLGAGRTLLRAETAARAVLLGGAPLDGPRHMWWNFVSSRKERLIEAARAWEAREFPPIPGDSSELINLPDGPGPERAR
jgi:redox-sensitive bicupin YhaK (pirin superfamily)